MIFSNSKDTRGFIWDFCSTTYWMIGSLYWICRFDFWRFSRKNLAPADEVTRIPMVQLPPLLPCILPRAWTCLSMVNHHQITIKSPPFGRITLLHFVAFSKHRTIKSKRKRIHSNLSAGCRVHWIRRGDLTYIVEWGVLDGDFRRKILKSRWIKTWKKPVENGFFGIGCVLMWFCCIGIVLTLCSSLVVGQTIKKHPK